MRMRLVILLLVFFSATAFSQKLSKPRPFIRPAPVTIPSVDTNALKQLLLEYQLKQPGMPRQRKSDTDNMPNGFTGQLPLTIYKGNNVYESTIDRMAILAPGSDFISNMPNSLSEKLSGIELNKRAPAKPY